MGALKLHPLASLAREVFNAGPADLFDVASVLSGGAYLHGRGPKGLGLMTDANKACRLVAKDIVDSLLQAGELLTDRHGGWRTRSWEGMGTLHTAEFGERQRVMFRELVLGLLAARPMNVPELALAIGGDSKAYLTVAHDVVYTAYGGGWIEVDGGGIATRPTEMSARFAVRPLPVGRSTPLLAFERFAEVRLELDPHGFIKGPVLRREFKTWSVVNEPVGRRHLVRSWALAIELSRLLGVRWEGNGDLRGVRLRGGAPR